MNRLTGRTNGVLVYKGHGCLYDTGMLSAEVETSHVRNMMDRLAAYEDTGLDPEEIVTMRERYFRLRSAISDGTGQPLDGADRLCELVQADRDGRCVVLPCKVGDTVYIINRHLGRVFECTIISLSLGHSSDLKNYIKTKWTGERGNESIRKWSMRQIGRYVFLTREEANAALKAQKGAGHDL